MQEDSNIKTIPTVLLLRNLEMACEQQDQNLINAIAYELACRIYVPNSEIDFDNLVAGLGYKKTEKEENKIKTLIRKR